jgi:hypothetical protein
MSNQFIFESKHKNLLLSFMALGLLSMVITFLNDDEFHTRFWSNFLHNTVFFTGIAFMALFLMSAKFLAYSGWHTVFKRLWESYALFLIVGVVLLGVLVAGVWGGFHHLYHWTDTASLEEDIILKGKSSFLNPIWYTVAGIVIPLIWYAFAVRMRFLSVSEDHSSENGNYQLHKKAKTLSAIFLPLGGFTSAALIWLLIMSVDAHWYSTLYAWYATASWLVAMIALTILMLIVLKSMGYFSNVTPNHFHDLGKYLFGFSIFWTYLWFSQFMLIWYGNIGEETIYFQVRMDEFPVLFYANLAINFILPFFLLIRNDNKRKNGTMFFGAAFVFLGHWLDFFLMLKPGILHTLHEVSHHEHTSHDSDHALEHASHFVSGFTLPGFLELGTFIGFLALFLYFTLSKLSQASTEPVNDPYLEESIHHHVI